MVLLSIHGCGLQQSPSTRVEVGELSEPLKSVDDSLKALMGSGESGGKETLLGAVGASVQMY